MRGSYWRGQRSCYPAVIRHYRPLSPIWRKVAYCKRGRFLRIVFPAIYSSVSPGSDANTTTSPVQAGGVLSGRNRQDHSVEAPRCPAAGPAQRSGGRGLRGKTRGALLRPRRLVLAECRRLRAFDALTPPLRHPVGAPGGPLASRLVAVGRRGGGQLAWTCSALSALRNGGCRPRWLSTGAGPAEADPRGLARAHRPAHHPRRHAVYALPGAS